MACHRHKIYRYYNVYALHGSDLEDKEQQRLPVKRKTNIKQVTGWIGTRYTLQLGTKKVNLRIALNVAVQIIRMGS